MALKLRTRIEIYLHLLTFSQTSSLTAICRGWKRNVPKCITYGCFCSLNLLFCGVLVAIAVVVASVSYCRSWLINLEEEVSAFHKYYSFVSPLDGVGAGELGCPSIRGLFQAFRKWRAAEWRLKRERIIKGGDWREKAPPFPSLFSFFQLHARWGAVRSKLRCIWTPGMGFQFAGTHLNTWVERVE